MWQLNVYDPSGEKRKFKPQSYTTIGTGDDVDIPLRDSFICGKSIQLWKKQNTPNSSNHTQKQSPYWIKNLNPNKTIKIGDLEIQESHLPCDIPFKVGETTIVLNQLESHQFILPKQPPRTSHWLTKSEKGKEMLWLAKKSAQTPLSIYLQGDTGTGKEVLAKLIHLWSDRFSGEFIPINCGALPITLAESELFGHVKGSFTGATHSRPGAFLKAHKGTLFLDEVADLSLELQVKLLRFLESGEIRPVGGDSYSHADVRIICATHQPLEKLVEEKKFRRDLYYRIASVTVEIPTLKERTEDIEMLSIFFAKKFEKVISQNALYRLKAYHWPGNVRELRHCIERACALTGPFKNTLNESDFNFLIHPKVHKNSLESTFGAPILSLKEMEKVLLIKALRIANGNRTKAAKILGVARSTLFEMLKRHKIKGPKSNMIF